MKATLQQLFAPLQTETNHDFKTQDNLKIHDFELQDNWNVA